MQKPLLIATGNRWRRDDGVGPVLVERLAARLGAEVETRFLSGEGGGVIEAARGREAVWLFDAAAAAGSPGRVTRIAAHADPVPAALCHHSTHRFGVAEAIEMARVLGDLPTRLELVAVEGSDFGEGEGLSPPVATAATGLVEALVADIRAALEP